MGKVPRHNCHPLRSRSWLRGGRSQLVVPSGPAPQSLLREPGAQPSWPLGSSDHLYRVGQASQAVTQADYGCYQAVEAEKQETFTAASRPGPRLGEGSGALQDPAPGCSLPLPAAPQLIRRLKARWTRRPQRRIPGSTSYLVLHLKTSTPPMVGWKLPSLPSLTVAPSQLAACGRGLCSPNQWLRRNPGPPWQLVPHGCGPLQPGPVAEQDHLPLLTGWEGNGAGSLLHAKGCLGSGSTHFEPMSHFLLHLDLK